MAAGEKALGAAEWSGSRLAFMAGDGAASLCWTGENGCQGQGSGVRQSLDARDESMSSFDSHT